MEDAEASELFSYLDKTSIASEQGETVATSPTAATTRDVRARFTVQESVSKTVSRGQKYLPHGGLGLCIVVFWAYLSSTKKLGLKQSLEERQKKMLDGKKDWLKSRSLLSMTPQDTSSDNTDYPEDLAAEEEWVASEDGSRETVDKKKDYDNFLKGSKASKVLAPSESFRNDKQS